MKSFKDIRDGLSEEYYTGPTAYVGGDKTNVGNVNGADLGNLPDTKTPYAAPDAMDHLRKGLQAELEGVHLDVVHTIGGHPLGEAPDDNPADDFAAREVGDTGQVPYEKTLPETSVRFSFESVGTGY